MPRPKLAAFEVRVSFTDDTTRCHTTRQRGFDAAHAWARSKYFESIRAGRVSMIAVRPAPAPPQTGKGSVP